MSQSHFKCHLIDLNLPTLLSLNATGQMVEFIKEHPDNEYFWEVKNESGEIGYVPSTHVLVKEQHVSMKCVRH